MQVSCDLLLFISNVTFIIAGCLFETMNICFLYNDWNFDLRNVGVPRSFNFEHNLSLAGYNDPRI